MATFTFVVTAIVKTGVGRGTGSGVTGLSTWICVVTAGREGGSIRGIGVSAGVSLVSGSGGGGAKGWAMGSGVTASADGQPGRPD